MMKKPTPQLIVLLAALGLALGAQAKDWPAPVKALEAQGVEVMGTFEAPGGLTGYAGMIRQQPLAIYVTQDGKQAVIGTMVDAKGAELSEEPLNRLVNKPVTERTWKQLEGSTWIADGAKSAPRVIYTFTDPNCPYCNKFWNDARPWVKSGKVQIRHVVVAILGPTSPGKAAALLSAPDPQAALTQHEQQQGGGAKPLTQISPKVSAQLDANYKLMQQLGFGATPAILYKDDDGYLKGMKGAPSGDMLNRILGPR
jgi:thiol:disulfide interchange protein DsbG